MLMAQSNTMPNSSGDCPSTETKGTSVTNGNGDINDNGSGSGSETQDAHHDASLSSSSSVTNQIHISSSTAVNAQINGNDTPKVNGPDNDKIRAILERTGYTLDVTSGQRKYGGPPPEWDAPPPGIGCEIFVGKIPREIFEDELIGLFEKLGKIWDLRLMMDPVNGNSRGYAFVTYCNRDDAQNAVQEYDNYEIRKGKLLKVNVSVPNLRLFIGNIPKSKSKEEIFQEFSKLAAGLVEVIVYSSPDDRKRNRGFCFLEYESHKTASLAKRKLSTARTKVWGCDILVDWADPQEEPDEETMSKVKVLYVRNLTGEVTEDQLKGMFAEFGSVERVKKIKDYAFVHFEDRNLALKAMNDLNGRDVGGAHIEISLAKPPSDRKKKEEVLRNRERRVMLMMQQRAMMVGVPRGIPTLMPSPQSSMPLHPHPQIAAPQRSHRQSRGRNSQPVPPLPMPAMPSPSAFNRPLPRNYGSGWNSLYNWYEPNAWWYSRTPQSYAYPGSAWTSFGTNAIPTGASYAHTSNHSGNSNRRTLWQPQNGTSGGSSSNNAKWRKQQGSGDGAKRTCKS